MNFGSWFHQPPFKANSYVRCVGNGWKTVSSDRWRHAGNRTSGGRSRPTLHFRPRVARQQRRQSDSGFADSRAGQRGGGRRGTQARPEDNCLQNETAERLPQNHRTSSGIDGRQNQRNQSVIGALLSTLNLKSSTFYGAQKRRRQCPQWTRESQQ